MSTNCLKIQFNRASWRRRRKKNKIFVEYEWNCYLASYSRSPKKIVRYGSSKIQNAFVQRREENGKLGQEDDAKCIYGQQQQQQKRRWNAQNKVKRIAKQWNVTSSYNGI